MHLTAAIGNPVKYSLEIFISFMRKHNILNSLRLTGGKKLVLIPNASKVVSYLYTIDCVEVR